MEVLSRRGFIRLAGALAASRAIASARQGTPHVKADHELSIEPATIQIGQGIEVRTMTYNGSIPGPILRLTQGKPVKIDVTNRSKNEDLVHWHGLHTDSWNDGAMEEGSPMIAPGATLRYELTPEPAGTRWYHTHAGAGPDLTLGTYSGQFGFLLVEGTGYVDKADQEFCLAIHHWEPEFVPMVETMRGESANMPLTTGSDVGYRYATVNAHMLGFGEPLRVKRGQRVLFRLLNASATENVVLALPGHTFRILAMDGNLLSRPHTVKTLHLAVAERVDAIVEMNNPGVWVLGSTLQKSRAMGLGVVVEYAGAKGQPVWRDPGPSAWDYTRFGLEGATPKPDDTFVLTIRDNGAKPGERFDRWTINNQSWPDIDPLFVERGKRYRLVFRNGSGDQHPLHLHRHTFEVVKIDDKPTRGLFKDTVNIMPLQTIEVDFVADNPGDTLWHCHQQLHMDYGFMQLIRYKETSA